MNSLKVPKIKKILLYEMKFLVPNYSYLQNPWLGGYHPQIPVLCVLCPQLNLLNPPRKKILGTPLVDPRAGLDGRKSVPTGIRSQTVKPVFAIPTELPGPLITHVVKLC